VPSVLINGLPAVTIGTLGNHGNVVTGGSGTIIIGMSGGGAAVSAVAALALLPSLCLPCLLAAAKRNATFVPLENLGAAQ